MKFKFQAKGLLVFFSILSAAAHSATRKPANLPSPGASTTTSTAEAAPQSFWTPTKLLRGLTLTTATTTNPIPSINLSRFISEKVSLRLDFGMSLDVPRQGDAAFGAAIDFGYRTTRFQVGSVKGFTQPSLVVGKENRGNGFKDDFYLGLHYRIGSEYYFNPYLAFGAVAGLALDFANGFENFRMGTSTTALFVTWYW